MHPEPVATGFLGAHHRARLDHLGSDVLEADGGLEHVHSVVLPEPAGHRRVVDAHDDRLAELAVLAQVVHQQASDFELVDEGPALVGRTGTIRVAVEEQTDVVATTGEHPEGLVDIGPDGFRVHSAEERIALLVDLRDPDLAAGEEP